MRSWPQGIKEIRDAREKAGAARQRTLDRFNERRVAAEREQKARAATLETKRNRFRDLSIPATLAAARRLRLIDLEADHHGDAGVSLNRPSLALLEMFLKALQERASAAVLQWPRGLRDASILQPLAMLAILGSSAEKDHGGYIWCPPVPDFRTLYYPWRGSGTGTTQRRMLVNRTEITKRNSFHLTRQRVGQAEISPELGYLHLTLGHLNHLKLRDAIKPHLAHPTLGEIYPTFGALGGEDQLGPFRHSLYELFGRVRHGAALDQIQDHRPELCQLANAPFALFGVCPRANVKQALRHPGLSNTRPPDVCILDLNQPGLSRLGSDWEKAVEEFLQLLVLHLPETPVLAITQDTYVHRRSAHLLARAGLADSPRVASRVIVRSSDDCLVPDPDIGDVSQVDFQFHSASGQGAAALRALSDAARASSDPAVAGILRHTMGNLRQAMSLPCGLRAAHEALIETVDGFLERRSASTILAAIRKQLDLCVDGAERQRLLKAEQMIDAAFDEFENDTPIGSLLAQAAGTLSRKSSSSVIAFSTDHELLLGRRRICTDDKQGEHIKKGVSRPALSVSRHCRPWVKSSRPLKTVTAAILGNDYLSSPLRVTSSPFFSAENGFQKRSSFWPIANSLTVSLGSTRRSPHIPISQEQIGSAVAWPRRPPRQRLKHEPATCPRLTLISKPGHQLSWTKTLSTSPPVTMMIRRVRSSSFSLRAGV